MLWKRKKQSNHHTADPQTHGTYHGEVPPSKHAGVSHKWLSTPKYIQAHCSIKRMTANVHAPPQPLFACKHTAGVRRLRHISQLRSPPQKTNTLTPFPKTHATQVIIQTEPHTIGVPQMSRGIQTIGLPTSQEIWQWGTSGYPSLTARCPSPAQRR